MPTRQDISFAITGLAGLFLTITIGWFIWSWGLTHHSLRAVGTVVQLIEEKPDHGPYYCPVFTFRDATGAEHTVRSYTGSNPPRFPAGSKVTVLYRANEPNEAHIEDRFFFWVAPSIVAVMALLAGAGGFILGRWPENPPAPQPPIIPNASPT